MNTFNKNWIKKKKNFRRTTLTFKGNQVSCSEAVLRTAAFMVTRVFPHTLSFCSSFYLAHARSSLETVYEQIFSLNGLEMDAFTSQSDIVKCAVRTPMMPWMSSDPLQCKPHENRDFVVFTAVSPKPEEKPC